jgi:exosortase/archaeosortase family protein
VLRFVLGFGLLIALFYACYVPFTQTAAFRSYVSFLAGASGPILKLLGQNVTVHGSSIVSPQYSIKVDVGCDGFEPAGLFVSAVLAFPASLLARVWFILIGTIALLVVNLIRIVSLFCIGVYSPRVMDRMHQDVWPVALIILVLFCWVIWARRAVQYRDVRAESCV